MIQILHLESHIVSLLHKHTCSSMFKEWIHWKSNIKSRVRIWHKCLEMNRETKSRGSHPRVPGARAQVTNSLSSAHPKNQGAIFSDCSPKVWDAWTRGFVQPIIPASPSVVTFYVHRNGPVNFRDLDRWVGVSERQQIPKPAPSSALSAPKWQVAVLIAQAWKTRPSVPPTGLMEDSKHPGARGAAHRMPFPLKYLRFYTSFTDKTYSTNRTGTKQVLTELVERLLNE